MKYQNFLFPFLVFTSLVGLATQTLFGWLYLHTTYRFGDLLYVLEKVDCVNDNLYTTRTSDPCTGYIYGSTLIKFLHLLGINAGKLEFFGFILIIMFTLVYFKSIISGKLNWKTTIFFFILYFSPPTVLLLERGNIDLLILLLICVSGYLLTVGRVTSGVLILILAGMFKFYPIPLALVTILLVSRKSRKFLLLIIWTFATLLIFKDLTQLHNLPWDARNMFGNLVWGEYLKYLVSGHNSHSNFLLSSSLGVFILFFIWFLNQKLFKNRVKINNNLTKGDVYYFGLYSGTYITCYFSGLNVDYRLIFLLLAMVYFYKITIINGIQKSLLNFTLCCTFFLSFNSNLLQPIGDLAQTYVIILLLTVLNVIFSSKIKYIFYKLIVVRRVILTRITRNS